MFLDDQKIAMLTLNNPSKLNALTEPMGDQLTAHVTELKNNKTIRKIFFNFQYFILFKGTVVPVSRKPLFIEGHGHCPMHNSTLQIFN